MTINVTPTELATRIRGVLDRALLGFDVDGVLAPVVEHADDASLLPDVAELLTELARRAPVVVLSGRSMASIERCFDLPPDLHVIGSHGLEVRGAGALELDDDERRRFEALEQVAERVVDAAGEGAWFERKPASVAVHTRRADPARAEAARRLADDGAARITGAGVQHGLEVVELLVRPTSKGVALLELADRLGRSPVLYVGDDLTDEDAFAGMSDHDFSVRVGSGESAARFRLPDPHAVRELIELLTRP